jgi:Zn-dependent protease with chaperone function
MHLTLILLALTIAWAVRLQAVDSVDSTVASTRSWLDRWRRSLGQFLFAPLLLLISALAVLCMGTQGQMVGLPAGWIGYLLALSFLGFAGAKLIGLGWQGWRSRQQVRTYLPFTASGSVGRILDTPTLFAAQVGFWQPELVVSQGLIDRLNPDQLEAVLTHEQAHVHYRDTFWFFWLGWLRRLTAWLPNTEALWQELLLLRELRADQWAAQQIDALLVAESLLLVVRSPLTDTEDFCPAFSVNFHLDRLEERIDALLAAPGLPHSQGWLSWTWLLLAGVPLLTVFLHS